MAVVDVGHEHGYGQARQAWALGTRPYGVSPVGVGVGVEHPVWDRDGVSGWCMDV